MVKIHTSSIFFSTHVLIKPLGLTAHDHKLAAVSPGILSPYIQRQKRGSFVFVPLC